MGSLLRRSLTLTVLLSAVVLGGGPGDASACSCASPDPVAAVAGADVVFTGSLIDHVGGDTDPVWTFAVDGWVKGDVPGTELVVQGQDYGFGCGVPFAWIEGSVAVFAERRGDELVSIGCSPTPSRAEFARTLADAAGIEASGTGEPAVLVVGRSGASNLRVLDDVGDLLVQADLDPEPFAAAHCPGTSLAAFWTYGPGLASGVASTNNFVTLVDLATLETVEQRELQSQWVSGRDEMVCISGGARVIVGRGLGPDEGSVTVATSNRDESLDITRDYDDVSRALVHPSGSITLLPSVAGGVLRTLSSADLEPLIDVQLDPSVAATHGAFSADGNRLAVLVTNDGNDMSFDTSATHVLLVDVVDGAVDRADELVELEAGGRGSAKWIQWIDPTTFAVERETDSTKIFDVHSIDGARLSSTDVGWGWGMVPLDGRILRARNGGVELIDRTGSAVALTPPPAGPDNFADLALAPVRQAPALRADALPGVDVLLLRDAASAEVIAATSDQDQVAGAPGTDPAAAGDVPPGERTAATSPAPDGGGFPWPVVIIGGLIIGGGVVALRNEFGNWRRRRETRRE